MLYLSKNLRLRSQLLQSRYLFSSKGLLSSEQQGSIQVQPGTQIYFQDFINERKLILQRQVIDSPSIINPFVFPALTTSYFAFQILQGSAHYSTLFLLGALTTFSWTYCKYERNKVAYPVATQIYLHQNGKQIDIEYTQNYQTNIYKNIPISSIQQSYQSSNIDAKSETEQMDIITSYNGLKQLNCSEINFKSITFQANNENKEVCIPNSDVDTNEILLSQVITGKNIEKKLLE